MTDDLTPRTREVLTFIQAHVAASGLPPTRKQISDAFGFSTVAAHKNVHRLVEAGYLRIERNAAHGIRLTGALAAHSGMQLPILGRVAAGEPIGADPDLHDVVLVDRGLFSLVPDYLLRVQGDSMRDDGIFDGDLVAVKRIDVARNGQIVVARLDDEITIKRYEQTLTVIRLLPRNPDFKPIVVPHHMSFAVEGLYCGLVRRS
jgi:repressor LexA